MKTLGDLIDAIREIEAIERRVLRAHAEVEKAEDMARYWQNKDADKRLRDAQAELQYALNDLGQTRAQEFM